ncbi:MAG: SMC-Scp complex subunit ScpB [Nitrosomonas sp.]|nr:SMC-Scp complex subunit ScpB [Nitrosomonas sp.]
MCALPSPTQPVDAIKILETALLTSQIPLSITQLRKLFDGKTDAHNLLNLLKLLAEKWQDSGLVLIEVASGWRFQTKPEMGIFLERLNPQNPPRYSRAVMETLAVITYLQPVTRGDIEAIRGVAVSSTVIKTLESRRWIESVGQREVPGRPLLYATTQYFLDDFNLQRLDQLPPLENMGQLDITTATTLFNAQNLHQEQIDNQV